MPTTCQVFVFIRQQVQINILKIEWENGRSINTQNNSEARTKFEVGCDEDV